MQEWRLHGYSTLMSRSLLQLVIRHTESLAAPDTDADGDLLHRFARTRDESAFAELLRRHGPMVWAVCRQSLPDHADAEDAFQAVFLALIRSPESVRGRNAVGGWLHGTAVRVVQKLKRTAVRRKQREHRAAGPEADRSVPEGKWDALIGAVHEEVQRLPSVLRTAFVMCELEGVRQPDAAARLGCKAGTLTSRLTRARQLLIERLSSRGLAPAAFGTLGLGVATASAAPPQTLLDSTLSLVNAAETVSPAILKLASQVTPMITRTRLAAATLLLACGFGMALFPSGNTTAPVAAAQDNAPAKVAVSADTKPEIPLELQYVPHDAAIFVHLDAAKLWGGTLGKSIRQADPKMFEEFATNTKRVFGATPDSLKTATIFVPSLKKEPTLGVVLVFNAPYDQAKLRAGLQSQVPGPVKTTLIAPSDTMAVLLVDLDEKTFGKPQPADAKGPLSAAIRDAGSGKHLVTVGSTLANLPDALLNEMVPEAIKPLLRAEAISGFIDLDKELAVEVRVKSGNAKDAGKALGAVANMAADFIGQGLASVNKEKTLTEIQSVLEAIHTSLKETKLTVEGDTARANLKMTAELPFAMAYMMSKRQVVNASARSISTNNLKQIAIAMHNYHDVTGAFPPAAVCDKTGKPMLSWRVLILPYIEQEALYKKFKLDEPWDSENNKPLAAIMPKVYANPLNPMGKAGETNYRVFVGKGAAFEYLKGAKLTDFKDGTSNTILTVTAKDSVIWTKPDELEFDPEKDMTKLLGFFEDPVCVIGFVDGSVRALSKTIEKKTLHGAITASGGEVFELK